VNATPITADTVIGYLANRNVEIGERCRATALVGGVSGSVILVESDGRRIVVKQALDQLRVADPWFAKPERADTEAAAITALHAITGAFAPELIDSDPDQNALVMTAAPPTWQPWKSVLLEEDFSRDVTTTTARTLGAVLGTWHRATAGDTATADRFDDDEAFEQLRVQPFHRTIRTRHPQLSVAIETCISDLVERRECLVHGDFSPKNILVDPTHPERLWVLDFEVAHYGAAVFDLAFLHCHLLLKAVHRPEYAEALALTATAFQSAYATEAGAVVTARASRRLGWQTACLLLARVDGISPAGYLAEPARTRVRDLAITALTSFDRPIADIWAMLEEHDHR
jgi:aminoglycoside phosphotransferase (APT) family kinase protein